MITTEQLNKLPETYLHVRESQSGEEWIMPIRGNATLDLKRLIKKWLKVEFNGEFALDGEIMPKLDGQYYARIMTDGRSPESIICWTGGGFYVKTTY